MRFADVVAFAGHQVHVCRYREAGALLRWLGGDLRGMLVLDVAGGDGYWAGQARRRGARAVSIDLSRTKMEYGRTLASPPALAEADALRLPFADGAFDRVMSICAIEHFDDGERYQFRAQWSEHLYLGLSAHGGRVGFNAAAALIPLVAASDRLARPEQGSIVLLRARRRSE